MIADAGSIGAADIRTYAPLRTVYNPFTGLYAANFVVANFSKLSVPGPLFLAFPNLPTGVTIANAKGKTSSGAPYVPFPGGKGLPASSQLKITAYFRNPLRQNLGTFFLHRPLEIIAGDQ